MEKFERQNRQRMRRLENMERHSKKQAEKQAQAEQSWRAKMKRRESTKKKMDAEKVAKRRKKASARLRANSTSQLEDSNSKISQKDAKLDYVRQRKAEIMKLKALRARKKEQKRQQQLQNLRFAEEKKQKELRKGWIEKEQRRWQLQKEEMKERNVRKVARELLLQTKRDKAFNASKASRGDRRLKTVAKIERQNKKAEFLEDLEVATNEELKERARLEWIHKQRLKQAKWESEVHNGSKQTDVENESFPSISMYRERIKDMFSPILSGMSQSWGSDDDAASPKGSFPAVSIPKAFQVRTSKSQGKTAKKLPQVQAHSLKSNLNNL